MIKFFRQSYAVQYVVIAILAIALWIPAFVWGKAVVGLEQPVTPLYNLIARLLGGISILQHIVAFVLLLFGALLFNAIMVKNQIVGKVSTMGLFVFILLMSLTQTQANFYPFAMSTIFILLAISNLFDVYQIPNPEMNVLKVGIFLAFASMCYFHAIWLLLWVFIVFPMVKKGSIRLQLIPFVGFFSVYFLFFVGVYLFGDFKVLMQGYADYFTSLHFTVEGFNLRTILFLVGLVVPTVLMFFGSNNSNFEKTIAVRVKISMTLILSVFAILFLFMGGNVLMQGLIFIVLSILVSYAFSYMGNTGWANLFMVVFMLLGFANLYYFKLL